MELEKVGNIKRSDLIDLPKETLAVWVLKLLKDAEEFESRPTKRALDGATAERTTTVSCPHCSRPIEVALLFAPRK